MRHARSTASALAVVLALAVGGCTLTDAGLAAGTSPPSVVSTTAAPVPAAPTSRPGRVRGPERLALAPAARPAQPALGVEYRLDLVDDHCVDRDLPAPPAADVALTILDRTYGLPADYRPDDLVPASQAGLTGASGSKLVRAVIVEDLDAMRRAWGAAGLTIVVDSAYRSAAAQAATFSSWAARLGEPAALARTARPGHSEHQLGTAIDVSSPGWSGRFGDWARETAEGAWLAEHAWEYGFVMSYPAGAEAETCFGYEPWHYRWIGREAAAAHRESGLTLREFLAEVSDG